MARRVAVLSDVHGNAVALAAVLDEVAAAGVDAIVWLGDLSWGWEPTETLALIRAVELPSHFVRGNGERFLLELRDGRDAATERDAWMVSAHGPDDFAFVETYVPRVTLEIAGLGNVLFTHGSPRSDEELLTSATPTARMASATADIEERVLVTGHTHVQYDRHVAGVRAINPGSVGMPYEGRPGAFWAVLGPDVELRCTSYDLDEAIARIVASSDPAGARMADTLREPPTPAEMIEHAERVEFAN